MFKLSFKFLFPEYMGVKSILVKIFKDLSVFVISKKINQPLQFQSFL